MKVTKPKKYRLDLTVNNHQITTVLIGQHYRIKHGHYMNDKLILDLIMALDGGKFSVDSIASGIEYFAADVVHGGDYNNKRIYRLIWLIEGEYLEVIGVINAYRRRKKVK